MMRSFLLSLVAAFLASAPHAGDAADGIFDIPSGFTAEATTQKLREALADASIARIRFQDGQQYKLLPFKIDRPVLLEGRAEIVPADLTQPLIEVTAPDVAIKQLTFLGETSKATNRVSDAFSVCESTPTDSGCPNVRFAISPAAIRQRSSTASKSS